MSFSSYKERSKADAAAILSKGGDTLEAMEAAYQKHFIHASLSDALQSYESSDTLLRNEALLEALSATRDALNLALEHSGALKKYVMLHVPQMEDGNNFGVTVQLAVLKEIKEESEAWTKALEELPKYYENRANAVDKLGIVASSTKSETKTTSESESKGGKDGDETKSSVSKSTEEKVSVSSEPEFHRVQHVYALDVQQYASIKNAFASVVSGYTAMLDNLEKNVSKIEQPKGSGGGNFGAMY